MQLVEVLWFSYPTNPIFDTYGLSDGPEDVEPLADTAGERYSYGDLWVRLSDPTAWQPAPADETPTRLAVLLLGGSA